jgi:hypothetical protein
MDPAKCIAVGFAGGILLGIALRSYALGILIGVAIGALVCFFQRRSRSRG